MFDPTNYDEILRFYVLFACGGSLDGASSLRGYATSEQSSAHALPDLKDYPQCKTHVNVRDFGARGDGKTLDSEVYLDGIRPLQRH